MIVLGEAAAADGAGADGPTAGTGSAGGGTPGARLGRGGEDAAALARARADVERLVADGAARGEAARRVAAATGIARRRLYGAAPDR